MAYDIPQDVLERERLRVKELRSKKKGARLPNGAAQFVHNGITYTLSANKSAKHGLEVKVASKEAAKEGRKRSLKVNQSSQLTPEQKKKQDEKYEQARILQEATGKKYHVDHRDPLKVGGGHEVDNLDIVEDYLNLRKGAKTSGPAFEAARADGLKNGRFFLRAAALGLDRAQIIERFAELQGALPGELEAASSETAARQNKMSEIAKNNGGINGTPDYGISESLFGRSFVDDERQDFAR